MSLETLPSRPLTVKEVYYGFDQSDQFIESTYVNVIIDEESNLSFAFDVVFVTEDRIIAVQYDVEEQSWQRIYEAENKPQTQKTDDGVVREKVVEARELLEGSVDKLEAEGLAGQVMNVEQLEKGRAITREAPELTERVRQQYQQAVSN